MNSSQPKANSDEIAFIKRIAIVLLLLVYAAMNHFNRVSMSVAGDERLMRDYQISPTEMGQVYSAFLLAYTICMAPGGWFIDRWGPRRALILMGFGTSLFVALTGIAGYVVTSGAALVVVLMLIRAAAGVLSAPLHPGAARVVSFCVPPARQSLVNGMVTGAALLGVSSTYYLFGKLMEGLGWQLPFVFAGTVTFLIAVAWSLVAADPPIQERTGAGTDALDSGAHKANFPGHDDDAMKTMEDVSHGPGVLCWLLDLIPKRSLLNNRSLVVLTLSYVAVGYFEFMLFYWLGHYFKNVLKFETTESRWFTTICTLSMAVGMFSGGWLSDAAQKHLGFRRGRAAVPVAAMIAGGVFLGLGLVSRGGLTVMFFALAMAAAGASEGPFWTTAIELGGKRGGSSAAIFNTGGNIGGFLAPIVTPMVGEMFGWQASIGLACLGCLAGAVLWLWIDPSEQMAIDRIQSISVEPQ